MELIDHLSRVTVYVLQMCGVNAIRDFPQHKYAEPFLAFQVHHKSQIVFTHMHRSKKLKACFCMI